MNLLKLFVFSFLLHLYESQNCFPIENHFLIFGNGNNTETNFVLAGRTSSWIGVSFSATSLIKDQLLTLVFQPPNAAYELINHTTLINSTKIGNLEFANDIRLKWNRIYKVSFTLSSQIIQNFTHIIIAENPEGREDVTHSHITFRSYNMHTPSIFC
jgi:hypothetical protein